MNGFVSWLKSKSGITHSLVVLLMAAIGDLETHPEHVQAILSWLGAHPKTAGLVAPLTFIIAAYHNPQVQTVVKQIVGDQPKTPPVV